MSKRGKHSGSASIRTPFCFRTFYTRVLTDVKDSIGVELYSESLAVLHSRPSEFRDFVSIQTQNAESSLAEAGFSRYVAWRQVDALLKKNVDFYAKSNLDRREAAFTKFAESEQKCKRTNRRFKFYSKHWSRQDSSWEVLGRARFIVQQVLGSLDATTLQDIVDSSDFGNGVTFGSTDPEHRNLFYKISGPQSVTSDALPLLRFYFWRNPHWYNYLCESQKEYDVVEGNRVAFVPKNWDVERTIAIEPSLNVFLQKGVDNWLKRRFRSFGINLSDQESSQLLACRGSRDGSVSTIDLSSASDTVSIELVRYLLPSPWFDLLNALRSKAYTLDKGRTWRTYEKFSSMGNATTFPLETLIFYAIARACIERCSGDLRNLKVYGDDIVVDTKAVFLLMEVLGLAGFTVNKEKSYIHGIIRETCGADFVSGVNIRPVYLSHLPRNPSDIYSLFNRLLVKARVPLPSTLEYLKTLVKRPHLGPYYRGMGDSLRWKPGLNTEFHLYFISENPPERGRWSSDYQSTVYRYRRLRIVASSVHQATDNYARYLCFLKGIEKGEIFSCTRFKWRDAKGRTTFWPSLRELGGWQWIVATF